MTREEMIFQIKLQGLKKGDRVLIILDDFTTVNGILAGKEILGDTGASGDKSNSRIQLLLEPFPPGLERGPSQPTTFYCERIKAILKNQDKG